MADDGGKKTKGRRKIELRRIENDESRLITFSKRRSGIYKKASELVTLCGAEVAFTVLSPTGKPFSFSHPSVESIVNRFVSPNAQPPPVQDGTHPIVEAHRKMRIQSLSQQCSEAASQLEAEKERLTELQRLLRQRPVTQLEVPVDELDQEMLEEMIRRLEELKSDLYDKLNEKSGVGASSSAGLFKES